MPTYKTMISAVFGERRVMSSSTCCILGKKYIIKLEKEQKGSQNDQEDSMKVAMSGLSERIKSVCNRVIDEDSYTVRMLNKMSFKMSTEILKYPVHGWLFFFLLLFFFENVLLLQF